MAEVTESSGPDSDFSLDKSEEDVEQTSEPDKESANVKADREKQILADRQLAEEMSVSLNCMLGFTLLY